MAIDSDALSRPLVLPCGALPKHRLAKSAMSDSLGDGAGAPTSAQCRIYERWARGGVALAIIGEVRVDSRYPEMPGNLVLGPAADRRALTALAEDRGDRFEQDPATARREHQQCDAARVESWRRKFGLPADQ